MASEFHFQNHSFPVLESSESLLSGGNITERYQLLFIQCPAMYIEWHSTCVSFKYFVVLSTQTVGPWMPTHASHCFKDKSLSSQCSQQRSVVWASFNSLASTDAAVQQCFCILDSLAISKAAIENFLRDSKAEELRAGTLEPEFLGLESSFCSLLTRQIT